MKLSTLIKTVFALLSIIFFQACQTQVIDINGSFEDISSENGEPEGWYATRVPETKGYYDFKVDSNISHSGNHSISIIIDESHPPKKVAYNWNRSVYGLSKEEKYELQGWIKTENLEGTAFIVLQCWKKETREMIDIFRTTSEYIVTGTTDWTFVKTSFEIPENSNLVRILVGIAAPDSGGAKAWFDDIQIVN